VQPFLLDEGRKSDTSTFEIDLLIGGVRYQLGFALNSAEVLREWLYAFPNGRKQLWYERESGTDSKQIRFGKSFSGENRSIEGMTRKNSLFLSAAAQNNHEQLSPIYRWITQNIDFDFGSRNTFSSALARVYSDPEIGKRLSELAAAADLGIVGFELGKEAMDEDLYNALNTFIQTVSKKVKGTENDTDDDPMPKETTKVLLQHKGSGSSAVPFPNANESAGTAAFLTIVGSALKKIKSGGVLCVDELDSSLHPLLALEIVRMFNDPDQNPLGSQLLFNTHDVNLLDSDVLRRDQIWFTEKDKEGGTHLYSLSDFKPRTHGNLKRGYLQGRYGAVPYIGTRDPDRKSG